MKPKYCSNKTTGLYQKHKDTINKAAKKLGNRQPKEFVEDLESVGTLALIEFDNKKNKEDYDEALVWTLTSRKMIKHIRTCIKQNTSSLTEEERNKLPSKNEKLTDYDQIINILVDKLPLKEKLVVKLYYWGEVSTREIGRVLKMSYRKTARTKSEAIAILKNAISTLGDKKAGRYS